MKKFNRKSPLKKSLINESNQSKKCITNQQISPMNKVNKDKSLNKLLNKNFEIVTLENAR